MCSSKSKLQINGRPVLQPNRNRMPNLERSSSFTKMPSKPPTSSPPTTTTTTNTPKMKPSLTPPISPRPKTQTSPPHATPEKVAPPRCLNKSVSMKHPKSTSSWLSYESSAIIEAPGSIAAARREEVANMQVQRKSKIAHYGRTKSAKYHGKVAPLDATTATTTTSMEEVKRCSFITHNSDPIYVAYHDEEWGVPNHDDSMLFELLALTGAQVGSDWASVLNKRDEFRDAFCGFDAEIVANFNERKITSIAVDYGIDLSHVRGIVDNSKRILEIKRAMGSFDNYLWGYVNYKPISNQYKSCHKIPVKTSKSESISKDMVRRGFRFVGPTVIYSFMQAAGLTNDHLTTCPRHHQCTGTASPL